MHRSRFWWVIIVFLVLIDLYFFQALRLIGAGMPSLTRTIVYSVYWFLSVTAMAGWIYLPYMHFEKQAKMGRAKYFSILAGVFISKFIGAIFFLLNDIWRGFSWMLGNHEVSVPRSFIFSSIGLIAAGTLFLLLLYGFRNKYKYKVHKVKLRYDNLPEPFRGLKLVHISDIHSGSFTNKDAVQKGIDKILHQEPDLILFTGDLVNNVADEMKDYMDVFSQLKAPMGVYSTLGNHDYGDYLNWPSQAHKEENLEKLKKVHEELGWRLLMNEHVVLERENEKIVVIGIENWSAKARFTSYGDLKKAYEGAEGYPFKILMSHDPSHWRAEVLKSYKDIDLTLSGHTHGMQFGFEVPGIKWSPVRYVYREWAGLYLSGEDASSVRKNPQKLYINRGFGFIGYPGRVGILPEITVLEFH